MVKKAYLIWFLFYLFELAPPHHVLNIDVQLSCGLVFVLFDVCEVLIPGLSVTGAFLEAFGKGLEYCFRVLLLILVHLILQGGLSLRYLFATIEQNVCDLGFLRGGGNDEVLLQSLLVEGPGRKLVLSIPVYPGKHI